MRATSIAIVNFEIYSFRFDPVMLIVSGISALFLFFSLLTLAIYLYRGLSLSLAFFRAFFFLVQSNFRELVGGNGGIHKYIAVTMTMHRHTHGFVLA